MANAFVGIQTQSPTWNSCLNIWKADDRKKERYFLYRGDTKKKKRLESKRKEKYFHCPKDKLIRVNFT